MWTSVLSFLDVVLSMYILASLYPRVWLFFFKLGFDPFKQKPVIKLDLKLSRI